MSANPVPMKIGVVVIPVSDVGEPDGNGRLQEVDTWIVAEQAGRELAA